ncbi:MAG: isochorismatase family cysteine hydrolase [Candidatus Paceibacterota bacterium]
MNLKEKIDPKYTVLLVIDIQNDFASPNGLRAKKGGDLSLVEPLIEKLSKIIDITKKAGVLTLYTQQIYDRSKLNDLQKEQYDLDGRFVMADINTDGYKFYKINPPSNLVFPKYNYNAFSNPDLLKTLQDHNIKTLVITGMDTFYCVETAIRNGFDLGYKIVVPEDLVACNAKHIGLHNRTLELVKKSYGVLTSSLELGQIWDR